MIPSARSTVPSVVIIIFTRRLFCFLIFWKVYLCENNDHYRPSGSITRKEEQGLERPIFILSFSHSGFQKMRAPSQTTLFSTLCIIHWWYCSTGMAIEICTLSSCINERVGETINDKNVLFNTLYFQSTTIHCCKNKYWKSWKQERIWKCKNFTDYPGRCGVVVPVARGLPLLFAQRADSFIPLVIMKLELLLFSFYFIHPTAMCVVKCISWEILTEAHNSDSLICQKLHMTYGFLLLFALHGQFPTTTGLFT